MTLDQRVNKNQLNILGLKHKHLSQLNLKKMIKITNNKIIFHHQIMHL